MSSLLLLVVAAIVLVGLLCNAGLLWVCCKLFRVRHEATESKPVVGVGLGRALLLSLIVLLVNLVLNAVALGVARLSPGLSFGVGAVSLLLPILVLRLGLPVGIVRALGINLLWGLLGLIASVAVFFAIRAYLFEAVVVPFGSMAETIYGYQKEVTCPACGLEFPVNCSMEVDPAGGQPVLVSGCTCPGCRLKIRLHPSSILNERNEIVSVDPQQLAFGEIVDPGWNTGDRVLFGKGLLGAGFVTPQRFDPIVFDHTPPDPFRGRDAAQAARPVRYLMRLCGLPGEMLAIHRGDLYVLDPDQVPAKEARVEDQPPDPFGPDPQAIALFEQGKFRILRKSPAQVLALMRLVYDSRHPARDLPEANQRRWITEKGWDASGVGFRHEGEELGWLRYRHALRGEERPSLITDFMGYNTWEPHALPGENWASELIVECEADPGSVGELTLEMSRGHHRFQAQFDLGKQSCALIDVSGTREARTLKETSVKVPPTGARLRFANVDERLIVWVGDTLVFGDGVEYDGPKTLIPKEKNDLERPASVGATGTVTIHRLRLLRDTYYTTARGGSPTSADVPELEFGKPDTFRHFADAPVAAYRIEAGHSFVLGDNSPESADSRLWGLVPQKQLLGKVLGRYYPFPRWGRVD